jgi:hypothetical protein
MIGVGVHPAVVGDPAVDSSAPTVPVSSCPEYRLKLARAMVLRASSST